MNKILHFIFLQLVLSGAAHAEGAYSGNVFGDMANIINKMFAVVNDPAFLGSLNGIGDTILYMGFITLVTWFCIKNIAIGRGLDGFFGDFIPLILTTGIAYIMIHGGGQSDNIVGIIRDTIDNIGQAVIPSHYTSASSTGDLVVQSIGKVFEVVGKVYDTDLTGIKGNIIEQAVGTFIAMLLKVIGLLGFLIVMAVCVGLFVANLIYSQIVFQIAAVFMPLFVAMIIIPPLSGLFDTWLRFAITAMFTKLVGLVLLAITSNVLDGMVAWTATLTKAGGSLTDVILFDFALILALILMGMVMTMIMGQTQQIANSLIGSGVAGFRSWGDLTKGPMGRSTLGMKDVSGSPKAKDGAAGPAHSLSALERAAPGGYKAAIRGTGSGLSDAVGKKKAGRDISAMENGKPMATRGPMTQAAQSAYDKKMTNGVAGQANSDLMKMRSGGVPQTNVNKMNPAARSAYDKVMSEKMAGTANSSSSAQQAYTKHQSKQGSDLAKSDLQKIRSGTAPSTNRDSLQQATRQAYDKTMQRSEKKP